MLFLNLGVNSQTISFSKTKSTSAPRHSLRIRFVYFVVHSLISSIHNIFSRLIFKHWKGLGRWNFQWNHQRSEESFGGCMMGGLAMGCNFCDSTNGWSTKLLTGGGWNSCDDLGNEGSCWQRSFSKWSATAATNVLLKNLWNLWKGNSISRGAVVTNKGTITSDTSDH